MKIEVFEAGKKKGLDVYYLFQEAPEEEILKVLEERGGAEFADGEGRTGLCMAAKWGRSDVLSELLVRWNKKYIDKADNAGLTPLMNAGKSQSLSCVCYLLAFGADCTLVDPSGKRADDHFRKNMCEISQSRYLPRPTAALELLESHLKKQLKEKSQSSNTP